MPSWAHLWTHFRFRGVNVFARAFKVRTQNFVNRLYDNTVVNKWLRANRRQQYARVFACVRGALDTPRRRMLMLSATGVYNSRGEGDDAIDGNDSVTDDELGNLVDDIDRTMELKKETLYCPRCSLRLIIDAAVPGIKYCSCNNGSSNPVGEFDGWTPFTEKKDVIIWQKEYPEDSGLYIYKVYGRFEEVNASDFALVQVDGAYRRVWDAAVASLTTVDRCHRDTPDQALIHWEVMWPRFFANRDYVYVRRYKEYVVDKSTHSVGPVKTTFIKKFSNEDNAEGPPARRKDEEQAIVIVSKSCEHPRLPVTQNAVRVTQYWSHMVIRSISDDGKDGSEFVLTYCDQPGGMPRGVSSWATGRAAPEFLNRMRDASVKYAAWRKQHPSHMEDEVCEGFEVAGGSSVREEDMESTQRGPIIDMASEPPGKLAPEEEEEEEDDASEEEPAQSNKSAPDEDDSSWWRYLHPFYYFA